MAFLDYQGLTLFKQNLDNEIKQNNLYYAECSTAGDTAAKTASLTGYTLTTGQTVAVKFTYTNIASNATLNINSTSAIPIYSGGEAVAVGTIQAGYTYLFRYNGTQYDLLSASGVATEGAAGLMSAADKTKLDQLAPGFFNTLGFNIATTDWTAGANDYTYTLTTTLVGSNTTIDVYYDKTAYKALKAPVEVEQVTGGIQFTTTTLPTAAVIGTVRILGTSSEHRIVEVTSATVPIDKGGTGAANAAGARSNLGLSNVENKSSETIRSEITSSNVTTALGYTPKETQNAINDPDASGTSLTFIDSISQNAQGVITPTKKTVSTFTGATQQGSIRIPGTAGLVPAPEYVSKVLRGDGTWGEYPINATTSYPGIVELTDSLGSTSTTVALTASAGRMLAVVEVTKTSVSSLPVTITNSNIVSGHVVVGSHLSNPSAKKSTWTITTSNGSLTIAGTINGTTDITLLLGYKRS